MKKIYSFFLLLGLVLSIGNVWGETVTFNAVTDVTADAKSYQTTEVTFTSDADGSEWKANGYGATANTNIVIGKGGANYLETPEVNGIISSIAVTWSGNTQYYLALQTTTGTELEAKQNSSTSTEETFTVSGSYNQLRLVGRRASGTSNAAATITRVVVTYTPGGAPQPTTYNVIYDANGGTGTMTDPNGPYEEGAEVTLLANTFNAPEGKLWGSWVAKDGSDNVLTITNGKFTMPASNVTVSAQWVADPNATQYVWVLTDLADLTANDVFVIVGNYNSTDYVMTNDNGTASAPTASSNVTISNNQITSVVANNMMWNVTGNTTSGYTFYPNGTTTTWLYCNTTAATGSNNNMRVGTGARKLFEVNNDDNLVTKDDKTARYVSVYAAGPDWRGYVGASTTVSFYKRIECALLTIGSTGYATYYNSKTAYFMPEGCTGYGFTFANGLETLAPYEAGEDVPAGEPLVITGTPGVKTLVFTTSIVSKLAEIDMNDLKGTDVAATTTGGAPYYALQTDAQGANVGFYWMAAGGAAFTNGAHKAYLALNTPVTAPERILFNNNDATNINNIDAIENAVKFMENGKLFIKKNGIIYNAVGAMVK